MRKVLLHKAQSPREAREFDIRFWKRSGAQARFAAAWIMVIDSFKVRGKRGNQSRLRRSVQNIKYL
ncbi:MAG: hypothetical protein A3I75_07065 [Deltaproteobacteria bacterium RIFCSPLOWO2_02_FULL_50_16]|nr:MAG: hypothetical protein A3B79_03200 [Deltaproteobacteria bacterium RIFCSPHIGHO2_02_FULL_50_15]OGQ56482.1 MAG: hypothetical protein A3I75_07065 [Deltaproteobacteria bacterium RIFCSPLOWO2_02_FULL_50_16]